MHHFQYLVYSRAPGDQEPFDRVFSSETSRREFLRRAAAVGISASAAVTLLGALAERTVAAAGTDILTAQAEVSPAPDGSWDTGYLAAYLQRLADAQIPVEAIGGFEIETEGPGHVLMIAVKESTDNPQDMLDAIAKVFEGHAVELVTPVSVIVETMDNLPTALANLGDPINTLIVGHNDNGTLAVQYTLGTPLVPVVSVSPGPS